MHVSVHAGHIGMSGVMGVKGAHDSDQAVAVAAHLTVEKSCVL